MLISYIKILPAQETFKDSKDLLILILIVSSEFKISCSGKPFASFPKIKTPDLSFKNSEFFEVFDRLVAKVFIFLNLKKFRTGRKLSTSRYERPKIVFI